jgi:hypothetical protein
MNGPAQKTRIAFMQDLDDSVVVNQAPALADLTAARGTGRYFFSYGLAACGTEFHRDLLRTKRVNFGRSVKSF